ncbi:MAG: MAPEG family protein, partial [Pseudoalteromonas sp.]
MTEVALSAYLAFYLYLIMLLVQWAVATFSKAKEPNAVPGKIDEDLSHDSFIFRA